MSSVDSNFNFLCGRPHGAGPPPPSTCVHLSLTPLRVDVINGWPLGFENSEKIAHSFVKYQMCLSNALGLITALETVLLCHVSYNHFNHATTAEAGHCRKR